MTPLTAIDTERLILNSDQRVIVAKRHAELAQAANAWAEVLVLLGIDEGRVLGVDLDKGHFVLAPKPDSVEG